MLVVNWKIDLYSWLTLVYFKGVVAKKGHSIKYIVILELYARKLPPHLQISSFRFVLPKPNMKAVTSTLP